MHRRGGARKRQEFNFGFREATERQVLKRTASSCPLSARLAGSAAWPSLHLWDDHAFGVLGRLLFAFDLVCFDLLLAGTLFIGLGRLVTHDCLPHLKSVGQNGAHQGEGHPAQTRP